MSLSDVRALTFDTGGTILDWHSGFSTALAAAGRKHGIERDWAGLANELRRRSLKAMLNLGEHEPPAYTIDGAHRTALEAILEENGLSAFTRADMHAIAYEAPHGFTCWPDFPAVLPKLRGHYIVASFTLLSYRLIIDTAKKNGLSWDAVFSCEGIGKYKVLPEAYRAVARYLQLDPGQCCMVAATTSTSMRPGPWATGPRSCADPPSGARKIRRTRAQSRQRYHRRQLSRAGQGPGRGDVSRTFSPAVRQVPLGQRDAGYGSPNGRARIVAAIVAEDSDVAGRAPDPAADPLALAPAAAAVGYLLDDRVGRCGPHGRSERRRRDGGRQGTNRQRACGTQEDVFERHGVYPY